MLSYKNCDDKKGLAMKFIVIILMLYYLVLFAEARPIKAEPSDMSADGAQDSRPMSDGEAVGNEDETTEQVRNSPEGETTDRIESQTEGEPVSQASVKPEVQLETGGSSGAGAEGWSGVGAESKTVIQSKSGSEEETGGEMDVQSEPDSQMASESVDLEPIESEVADGVISGEQMDGTSSEPKDEDEVEDGWMIEDETQSETSLGVEDGSVPEVQKEGGSEGDEAVAERGTKIGDGEEPVEYEGSVGIESDHGPEVTDQPKDAGISPTTDQPKDAAISPTTDQAEDASISPTTDQPNDASRSHTTDQPEDASRRQAAGGHGTQTETKPGWKWWDGYGRPMGFEPGNQMWDSFGERAWGGQMWIPGGHVWGSVHSDMGFTPPGNFWFAPGGQVQANEPGSQKEDESGGQRSDISGWQKYVYRGPISGATPGGQTWG